MNFLQSFAHNYKEAVKTDYDGANVEAGWQMPVTKQIMLIDTATDVDSEEKRFYQDVFHQHQTSKSAPIQYHGLPDQIESYQSGSQQVVTVGAGGTGSMDIRKVEIPLLYEDDLIEDSDLVGTDEKKFLAQMDGQIGGRIIEQTVWVGFNGVLQNTNFQKHEPENSNIGWIKLMETNKPSLVFAEKRAGSGIISFGDVRKVPCDSGAIVDKGAGKVGIPVTEHGFPVGALITLYGFTSANYKNSFLVDADTTENEIVITATYAAENVNPVDQYVQAIPDYANLDELIMSFYNSSAVTDGRKKGWRALVSRSLMGTKETELYAKQGNTPTEVERIEAVKKKAGSLDKYSLPSMPAGTVILSNPKNFSIGHHKKKTERTAKYEEDKRGLVVRHKYFRGFAIQDADAVIVIQNIVQIKRYMV